MGEVTKKYEKVWSEWVGRRSVFVNSGSSANLAMYSVLDCSSQLMNKKVIVPSNGWATTIDPAIQLGFQPLMCEADPDTFGLDLDHLEELLEEHRPATVMLVHALGVPHKMDELMALKEKYEFILLEDACASVGSAYKGKRVGTFGDMSSFSTYFGHQSSSVEGGFIFTDNKEFYNILRMIRSHGWAKDLDEETYNNHFSKYNIDPAHRPFAFFYPGYNIRPTDIQAKIGLGQFEKFEWVRKNRIRNHELYKTLLRNDFGVQKYSSDEVEVCSISFAILAKDPEERDKVVHALNNNSIETRLYSAANLGLHPFWYDNFGKFLAPNATRLYSCGLFLPNHPDLERSDIEFISKVALGAKK